MRYLNSILVLLLLLSCILPDVLSESLRKKRNGSKGHSIMKRQADCNDLNEECRRDIDCCSFTCRCGNSDCWCAKRSERRPPTTKK
ncbi:hypothetical protein X975_02771, partial [Stegodyphus mimosarum]